MSAPPVREVNPFGAAPSRRGAQPSSEAPREASREASILVNRERVGRDERIGERER